MHEYSIAMDIIKIAEEKSGTKKIKELDICTGILCGVYNESLKFYLENIFYEKYKIDVIIKTEIQDAEFQCSCGEKYVTDNMLKSCPACGGFERTILKGNECIIKSIKTE